MNEMSWKLAVLAFVLAVFSTIGCAWLRGACANATPAMSSAQMYVMDAEIALDQVDTALPSFGLPPERLAAARVAVEKARDTLAASTATLGALGKACTSPDIATVFGDFVAAWQAIERATQLPKVMSIQVASTVNDTTPKLRTPAVVLALRGAR
jgi:hypothetical protein